MPESIRSRLYKLRYNLFPAYRRTGGKITYVSSDLHEVKIKLAPKWNNKSHIGSIWGGSMYGAIDPVYAIMLSVILGRKYVAVDKRAEVDFIKPGRTALYTTFILAPEDVHRIRQECDEHGKTEREYEVELKDDNDVTYLKAKKLVHIRKRQFTTNGNQL